MTPVRFARRRLVALFPRLAAGMLLASAGGAARLGAQAMETRGGLTVRIGSVAFGAGAALGNAMEAGVETGSGWTTVAAPRPLRGLALATGVRLSAARPLTDGRQFPLVPVRQGDTTRFTARSQRVVLTHADAELRVGLPLAAGRLFASAAGGAYALWVAARDGAGARVRVAPMLAFGGGFEHPLTYWLHVRGDVRTVRYFAYDRAMLDATRGRPVDQRVDDVLPPSPTSRTPQAAEVALSVRVFPRERW